MYSGVYNFKISAPTFVVYETSQQSVRTISRKSLLMTFRAYSIWKAKPVKFYKKSD